MPQRSLRARLGPQTPLRGSQLTPLAPLGPAPRLVPTCTLDPGAAAHTGFLCRLEAVTPQQQWEVRSWGRRGCTGASCWELTAPPSVLLAARLGRPLRAVLPGLAKCHLRLWHWHGSLCQASPSMPHISCAVAINPPWGHSLRPALASWDTGAGCRPTRLPCHACTSRAGRGN